MTSKYRFLTHHGMTENGTKMTKEFDGDRFLVVPRGHSAYRMLRVDTTTDIIYT
jgi:hypothetical protein